MQENKNLDVFVVSANPGQSPIETLGPDRAYVTGRNGQRTLRVGDVFNAVLRGEVPLGMAISLKIVAIEAYRRKLPDLDRGMTASLELHGNGIALIRDGDLLGFG